MKIQKKKLIEVALPLNSINEASIREKSTPSLKGHPRGLHLWWSRKPLANCRAVIFAQLVDDPSSHPDKFPTIEAQEQERQRLFLMIEQLVKWENFNNHDLLRDALSEIEKSCEGDLPLIYDPFSGSGSIPFEAQQLGLDAYGSDLNPVAVLVSKALLEIPLEFNGLPPVNCSFRSNRQKVDKNVIWKETQGLAEDIRYYGKILKDQVYLKVANLYPSLTAVDEENANPIAWIWARTVATPNPAVKRDPLGSTHVPLTSTFLLSAKKDSHVWIKPVINSDGSSYRFEVTTGTLNAAEYESVKTGTKTARGPNFKCLLSDVPITGDYIKAEGKAGRLAKRLLATVVRTPKGIKYIDPDETQESADKLAQPKWEPEGQISNDKKAMVTPLYGLGEFKHLFTKRQLATMSTFCDGIQNIRQQAYQDALDAAYLKGTDGETNNTYAEHYANAVALYLALALDKMADYGNTLCTWNPSGNAIRQLFNKQTLAISWEFAEANPFEGPWSFMKFCENVAMAIEKRDSLGKVGYIDQVDAMSETLVQRAVITMDPPYYDNVPYSDLSDFFYVWLRKSLKDTFPDYFNTMLTPKENELIASPYRHGSKSKAEQFFVEGMTKTLLNLGKAAHPDFPMAIYYAFKQSELKEEGYESTGWETFLDSLIKAGWAIQATWPMRTENATRMRGIGSNALASSILLVCRKLQADASIISRGAFIRQLKKLLPSALNNLHHSNITPVDMTQACIGQGMSIFTNYKQVLESDGTPMTVKTALSIINEIVEDASSGQEAKYDADTRFAIAWFSEYSFKQGPFQDAETLALAKNVSVKGVVESGIIESKAGKVRLLKREELLPNWDPQTDTRLTVWESAQYLVREFELKGETSASRLLSKYTPLLRENVRELCYYLHSISQKKKYTDEATSFNNLIASWISMSKIAGNQGFEPRQLPVQE